MKVNIEDLKNIIPIINAELERNNKNFLSVERSLDKLSFKLPKGLKLNEVFKIGKYQVISQSKIYSIGFSDKSELLISNDLPLIAFGDHSKTIKLIDKEFIIGADGVKLIKPKKDFDINFYYLFLHGVITDTKDYGRHYSLLKKGLIPDLEINEQKEFVNILNNINNKSNIEYIESIRLKISYIINKKVVNNSISTEITHQLDLIKNLRQAFLREAMQGLLVSNETSDGKTGADLLAEIQAEKTQLVKEKKIKKPKPLAPITDEEIPFDIPENWTWCRLEEISSIITDGTHHTPTYFEDGIKFLSSRNVTGGYINWDLLKYIDKEQHIEMQKRVSPKIDDILLAKNGTTGIAALVDRDEVFDIYVSLALIRTLNANKKFILRVINSPYSKEQFDSRLRGVGVKNLHLNQIREVIVPLPPLEIQERIVAKLDELMSYCDALEEQVKQSQQTNELLLQQVLREALGA
ncbi:restriction endonuclease subunit S [Empedobacter falsenii]